MRDRFLMGLDIGSGHVACLLLNIDNHHVVSAVRGWRYPDLSAGTGWGADLDTRLIWRLLKDATAETLRKADAGAGHIIGISVAGMRHALVLIGKSGDVLFAVPTKDARAASHTTELAAEFGTQLYQRTGHWPLPIFAAPRLLHLAAQSQNIVRDTHAVLSISDWLSYRMTGTISYERSLAAETLLFDLAAGSWVFDIIETLGLEPLPEEGGFYKETYRSGETIPKEALPCRYKKEKNFATTIYYLLTKETFSAIHRLPTDEVFHFYLGDPVTMLLLHPDGRG